MNRFLLIVMIVVFALASCKNQKDEVKFEKDGYFYIYAVINDSIEGRFVFDTGADGLYLDSAFVKKHSSIIKSDMDTARMRGAGATGYRHVFIVKDTVNIRVGNYFHSFTASPILKLTDLNGDNIAGIIGNDFVKNKVLAIDNEHLSLRIDTAVNPKKYETIIPFKYVNGRIYVAADLRMSENKTISPNLMVDLGCSDAIVLNAPYYKALKASSVLQVYRLKNKLQSELSEILVNVVFQGYLCEI